MATRFTISAALMLLATFLPFAPVAAQPYPFKPIRLIVDGPAGGINDIWARRYAQRISEAMQQTIVVENRPGASGTIAAEAVAKASPDGYTMFFGGMNPLVAYPGAGGVVRYDPARDFVPVAVSTMGYPAFVVNSGLGIKSLADLVERAKAKPDEFICGTSGQASVQHFACVKAAEALGIKMRTVPYKGGSAALMDAAAGQIQVSVGYTAELEPHMAQNRLIALASFAPNRLPKFPAAPSFGEAGYSGLELPSFAGFFVPAGTPTEIIDRFNAEAIKAMARPEMTEWVKSTGAFYIPFKPSEFADLVRREQAKWKKMSMETGIRVE
jgi:tripartite-type tricarboxylate transporter receptor subunit TctC